MKVAQQFVVIGLLQSLRLTQASMFDSVLSYRHGNSLENIDTARFPFNEEPDAPDSVDEAFAHTESGQEGLSISIVHCYSIRNGLYGSAREARVLWTKLDFTNPDYAREGHAKQVKAVAFDIKAKIEHFAVKSNDLTAFLMASEKSRNRLLLHIIKGPPLINQNHEDQNEVDTFSFSVSSGLGIYFTEVKSLLLSQEGDRAIFYAKDFVGEIHLQDYLKSVKDADDAKQVGIKILRIRRNERQTAAINGSHFELQQIQPSLVPANTSDHTQRMFMLLKDFSRGRTSLRIDTVLANDMVGCAMNIARLNTNAYAAYNQAQFSQIAQLEKGNGQSSLVFATFAYQSTPVKSYFLTISSVTQNSSATWSDDMSQEFVIEQSSLFGENYIKVLGIDSKSVKRTQEGFNIDIAAYFVGQERLGKADFTISVNNESIELKQANFVRSFEIFFRTEITRVASLSLSNSKISQWPDFYLFSTSTRNFQNQTTLVLDGLLISDHTLRRSKKSQLMVENLDSLELWSKNGPPQKGILYQKSLVLPQDTPQMPAFQRTQIVSSFMRSSQAIEKKIVPLETDQNQLWSRRKEECDFKETSDVSRINTRGLNTKTLVSYLKADESSLATKSYNTQILKELENTFEVSLDTEMALESLAERRCQDNTQKGLCKATLSLCFSFSLEFYIVTKAEDGTLQMQLYEPSEETLIKNTKLKGQTFTLKELERNQFYLAATLLNRVDGESQVDFNSASTTKLVVFDTGEAPQFRQSPVLDVLAVQGQQLDFRLSELIDPEGSDTYLKATLRKALLFAYFDDQEMKLVVTSGMIPGEYPISIEYGEVINSFRMPTQILQLNLTVVPPELAPPPPPPPITSTPRGKIKDFMMNGKFILDLDEELRFPEGLLDEQIDATRESVPLIGSKPGRLYDLIYMSIIPGEDLEEPEKLEFSFTALSISDNKIEYKLTFDNPLLISQNPTDPERLQVLINLDGVTNSKGRFYKDKFYVLETFVPRQIPSEAVAAAIESSGEITGAAATGAMASNFIITLLMAGSLNQLWSMMNGLQLAVHMPLFAVAFPANANFFITFLIDVATFDIMPPEATEWLMSFPEKDSFNLAFQSCRYESMYAVENLGTCFMLINIFLIQVFIFLVCYCCKDRSQCAARCEGNLKKALFWGSLIRLIFEGYLELCCSIFVSLTDIEWERDDYAVTYNNVFSITFSIILIGLPLFIAGFYPNFLAQLEEEDFKNSYGDIYDGLVLDKDPKKRLSALFYPFWFVTRRLIFATIVITMPDEFYWQVFSCLLTGTVNIIYLIQYQPFEDKRVQNLELMNEATNFILLYHTMLFSNYVESVETRFLIGWSFIAFVMANMLVHFTFLILDTVMSMKEKCQKCCCCSKNPETEQEEDAGDKNESKLSQPRKELSVIQEDRFESNMSSEGGDKSEASFESDWQSEVLGRTEKGGYNLKEIRWDDLGNKFIKRDGKISRVAEVDVSYQSSSKNIDDDEIVDPETAQASQTKMHLQNNESKIILNVQPSGSLLHQQRSKSCLKMGKQHYLDVDGDSSVTNERDRRESSEDQDQSDTNRGRQSEHRVKSYTDLRLVNCLANLDNLKNLESSDDRSDVKVYTRGQLIEVESLESCQQAQQNIELTKKVDVKNKGMLQLNTFFSMAIQEDEISSKNGSKSGSKKELRADSSASSF